MFSKLDTVSHDQSTAFKTGMPQPRETGVNRIHMKHFRDPFRKHRRPAHLSMLSGHTFYGSSYKEFG